MTNTQALPVFLSANEIFKSGYGKYIRWSVLAALAFTCLFVWLMPSYEPIPYVLREKVIKIYDIDLILDIKMPEEPIAAPPLVRNLEAVSDLDETPDEFYDTMVWPTWVPPHDDSGSLSDDVFLPSSANPRLLFQAKPDYSQVARMSGLEGVVIVKVLVGKLGQVEAAQVIQGVHPILNQSALKAAYRCRFEAGTQRTVPVQAWVAVPYSFRLH